MLGKEKMQISDEMKKLTLVVCQPKTFEEMETTVAELGFKRLRFTIREHNTDAAPHIITGARYLQGENTIVVANDTDQSSFIAAKFSPTLIIFDEAGKETSTRKAIANELQWLAGSASIVQQNGNGMKALLQETFPKVPASGSSKSGKQVTVGSPTMPQ